MLGINKKNLSLYARKKEWLIYLPLLTLALYMFVDILLIGPDHTPFAPIHILQKGFFFLHESTHVLFTSAPGIIRYSSGSIIELLVPTLMIIFALKARYYFVAIYSSVLLMLTSKSVGAYMADAIQQKLLVVNPFVPKDVKIAHDWNIVFVDLKILPYSELIGDTVRVLGTIICLIALCFGVYLLILMGTINHDSNLPAEEKELIEQWNKHVRTPLNSADKCKTTKASRELVSQKRR